MKYRKRIEEMELSELNDWVFRWRAINFASIASMLVMAFLLGMSVIENIVLFKKGIDIGTGSILYTINICLVIVFLLYAKWKSQREAAKFAKILGEKIWEKIK